MFRVEKKWYVSLTLGDVSQWNIHNPSISEDIPRMGWKFKDFNGRSMWAAHSIQDSRPEEENQSTIVFRAGLLEPCSQICVTLRGEVAGKYPDLGGQYDVVKNIWRKGRPVFMNCSGRYLYVFCDRWHVGDGDTMPRNSCSPPMLGNRGVINSKRMTPSCPALSDWRYAVRPPTYEAGDENICVSCSIHGVVL